MGYPAFSVAISVYKNDTPGYLADALESIILHQTVRPAEVVLVVDGPVSAQVSKVIEEFEKTYPIFAVIRLEENKGLGNALRLAVEKSRYELIARMDSDDISVPDRFEQQLKAFEDHPEMDIIGGDIEEFVDSAENVIACRKVPVTDGEIKQYMRKRCPLNHVSVMFRKEAVLRSGNYQDWFQNEDYYLWLRMMKAGCSMGNTGSTLVRVRVGQDMYRRRGGMKYYRSEAKLQKYMYKEKMISLPLYLTNVLKRLIVQVLLPNRLRGWVFQHFARE